jgi:hypothetical protein
MLARQSAERRQELVHNRTIQAADKKRAKKERQRAQQHIQLDFSSDNLQKFESGWEDEANQQAQQPCDIESDANQDTAQRLTKAQRKRLHRNQHAKSSKSEIADLEKPDRDSFLGLVLKWSALDSPALAPPTVVVAPFATYQPVPTHHCCAPVPTTLCTSCVPATAPHTCLPPYTVCHEVQSHYTVATPYSTYRKVACPSTGATTKAGGAGKVCLAKTEVAVMDVTENCAKFMYTLMNVLGAIDTIAVAA